MHRELGLDTGFLCEILQQVRRAGGEKEQRIRADAFARLPGVWRLSQADPETLLAAVDAAIGAPGPPPGLVDMNGAATTARMLLER